MDDLTLLVYGPEPIIGEAIRDWLNERNIPGMPFLVACIPEWPQETVGLSTTGVFLMSEDLHDSFCQHHDRMPDESDDHEFRLRMPE